MENTLPLILAERDNTATVYMSLVKNTCLSEVYLITVDHHIWWKLHIVLQPFITADTRTEGTSWFYLVMEGSALGVFWLFEESCPYIHSVVMILKQKTNTQTKYSALYILVFRIHVQMYGCDGHVFTDITCICFMVWLIQTCLLE